jgi:hypothetical protein
MDTKNLTEVASQASPRPWTVEGEGRNALVRDATGRIVFVRHRLGGEEHEANAHFAAASSAANAVQDLLNENARLRACALKYLDFLQISNREEGLEKDLRDPDMVGEALVAGIPMKG